MKTTHFGPYGGRYVPEMLIPTFEALAMEFAHAKTDPKFLKEFQHYLKTFSGRPTPLTYASNMTEKLGGARVYLKNEGANLTGAHKITHCIGQALIAKRLGKTRIIAETGAGQHGVATATVCAKFGMECTIYMGAESIRLQRPNVFMMEQLGAKVIPVYDGSQTLKDAVNAAIKDLAANFTTTHYMLGSVVGPDPYPEMNRFFQSIVGREIKSQLHDETGSLPDIVIACVGGGSNAMGAFAEFIPETKVKLIAVEAGGKGSQPGQHAVRCGKGKPSVIHGYKSLFLIDDPLRISTTHSLASGLDYPGIGPELANLYETRRVEFASVTDKEALDAANYLAKTEGILPALESAHAVAHAMLIVPKLSKKQTVVINISGRGDKDLFIHTHEAKDKSFYEFLHHEIERNI